MDVRDVYSEVVELRKELRAYHQETITNKTDLVWVKKLVFGGFGLVFAVLGSLISGAIGTH